MGLVLVRWRRWGGVWRQGRAEREREREKKRRTGWGGVVCSISRWRLVCKSHHIYHSSGTGFATALTSFKEDATSSARHGH